MNNINISNFKKTLSKFGTGITVICLNINNTIYGKTINSFSSLSLKPPLVLFSLDKKSSSINKYNKSKYLSINILSSKQKKISIEFSKKSPNIKKIKFIKGLNNTVLLPNSIGNLECFIENKIPQGDHVIFICKVLNVSYNNKLKPLFYFNSKYC